MNNRAVFFVIGAFFAIFCADASAQTFGTEFVQKATPAAKQLWTIVKWICGICIGASLLSAGYKITQKGNNDVKIEIVLILVFIGIFLITPNIINWISGTSII